MFFFLSLLLLTTHFFKFVTQFFLLLKLFCLNFFIFSFYLSYICYSICFVSNVIFYSCLKHWKLFCYWFFLLLFSILFHFNFAFFISVCISVFLAAHFFQFYIFLWFCFFITTQLFSTSLTRFFFTFAWHISFASHVRSTFISDVNVHK